MSIIIISYIHTNIKEGDSRDKVRKKRKLAFNYPYIIIGSISFIPTIIIISSCILLGLETPIIFSIMSIVLLASSLIAIIIYMISKEYFEDILIETAYYVENNINGGKISLGNKLLTQLLPIILGTLMLMVSILNYLVIYDKGVIQEKLYLEILKKEFIEDKKYSLEEITEKLKKIEKDNKQENVTKVLAYTNNIRNPIYGKEYLNNFAIEYINMFYNLEKQDTVYTEYSKNKQISMIRIETDKGYALIGIGFRVFSNNITTDIRNAFMYNNYIYINIHMVYRIYYRKRYI